MLKSQVSVNDKPFNLMKFCQMSIIQGFISEDSINREEFSGPEWFFFSNLLQILRRNCRSMSSQQIFVGFLRLPFIVISSASKSSLLMNIFHSLEILFIFNFSILRMSDEESIMSISGRMGLRLEQRIEIPERAFYISVSFHFFKSHLNQNLNKLLTSFHQKMEITIFDVKSLCFRIEFLKFFLFP